MTDPNKYPKGWDAERVRAVIEHYDNQTEDEGAEEIESALIAEGMTSIVVPNELLPAIRKLLATHHATTTP